MVGIPFDKNVNSLQNQFHDDFHTGRFQWLILFQFFHKWRFTRNLYLVLLHESIWKFYHSVTFVITKDNLMSFWHTAYDWCIFQLVLFKFLKAENRITCNLVLCIKMTLTSIFWSQKWQNGEIFNLMHSIIPSINSL